jgi:hypothetical protein
MSFCSETGGLCNLCTIVSDDEETAISRRLNNAIANPQNLWAGKPLSMVVERDSRVGFNTKIIYKYGL